LLDWLVFSNVDKLAKQLDPSRLAVTELDVEHAYIIVYDGKV